MAGRVDQVEDVILAVMGAVVQAHGLRLDGNAALLLDIHIIENLLLAGHFARVHAAGELDQPVGEGGFPVVDMGDDGEIADILDRDSRHGREITPEGGAFKTNGALSSGCASNWRGFGAYFVQSPEFQCARQTTAALTA